MQRRLACLFAYAITIPCAGCAAVLGSKQKTFDLQSSPQGADVFTDGNRLGTTPLRIKLSNTKAHTFVFKMDGYKEATCHLTRGTDGGWVILDVLMGLVPIIVDAATNSWSQTQGKSCAGALEPLGPMSPAPIAAASGASDSAGAPIDNRLPSPSPGRIAVSQLAPASPPVLPATPAHRVVSPAVVPPPVRSMSSSSSSVAVSREFNCDGRLTAPRDNPQDELRRLYIGDLRRAGILECLEELSPDLLRELAGPQFRLLSPENRDSRLSRLLGLYGAPVNMLFELWDASGRFAEYSSIGFRQIERSSSTAP
jgi:hypothetical protein